MFTLNTYSSLLLHQVLCKKLYETQRVSERPELFENALTESFEQLGFSSKHKGGRNEPDILLSIIGHKIVVDAKTTKEGEIGETYVNFDALERYKRKHVADYVAVIAPGFSGVIKETAKRRKVILIETQAICKALKEHMIFKYRLEDILSILFESEKIVLTPGDVESSTKGLEKKIQTIQALLEVIETGEMECSVENLTIAFRLRPWRGLKFEGNEIEEALEFLSTPPLCILIKKSEGRYSLCSNLDEILEKLGMLYKAVYPSTEGVKEKKLKERESSRVSKGLGHIFEVVKLTDRGSSYKEGFRRRANESGVTYSTVSAACIRNIGLKIHEFVEIIKKENRDRLISLLQRRFPGYKDMIEQEIGRK